MVALSITRKQSVISFLIQGRAILTIYETLDTHIVDDIATTSLAAKDSQNSNDLLVLHSFQEEY